MRVDAVTIRHMNGEKLPILGLDRQTSDALAVYAKQRWPTHTRKAVEREFDLTPDAAKAVVEGKASKNIIDQIWKHPRGRWAVALPVLAAVIGSEVFEHFAQERARLRDGRRNMESKDRELAEVVRHPRARRPVGTDEAVRLDRERDRRMGGR